MYYKYSLNIKSSWSNLPWKKIYFKILILQKKIFQATKQYNFKKVYKIQKYLLNSNEAKLFSVESVLKQFDVYEIKDKDKFLIFKSLYSLNKNQNIEIHLFIEQIKQYLIYLCIKPEWQAKSIIYFNNSDLKQKNFFLSSVDQYIINNNYNIKYTFSKHLINKIQSFPYINNTIRYWLNNNYCLNLLNTFNIIYESKTLNFFIYKNNISINQYFSNLLFNINLIGLDWYLFYLSSLSYNYDTKNTFYNIIQNNTNLYKYVLSIIKINLDNQYIFYKLNKIIQRYFYKYLNSLSINYIEYIYRKINFLLYYWYKKNYKIILYRYEKKNNYYLNIFLYGKKNKNNYSKLLF